MSRVINLGLLARYIDRFSDHVRGELHRELSELFHKRQAFRGRVDKKEICRSMSATEKLVDLVARDPKTPASLLSRMRCRADADNDQSLLVSIALHMSTPPYSLACLAESRFAAVRQAVSENRACPYSVLERLSEDISVDVRYRLAENPYIPINLLEQLREDENAYVSSRAEKTISRLNFEKACRKENFLQAC